MPRKPPSLAASAARLRHRQDGGLVGRGLRRVLGGHRGGAGLDDVDQLVLGRCQLAHLLQHPGFDARAEGRADQRCRFGRARGIGHGLGRGLHLLDRAERARQVGRGHHHQRRGRRGLHLGPVGAIALDLRGRLVAGRQGATHQGRALGIGRVVEEGLLLRRQRRADVGRRQPLVLHHLRDHAHHRRHGHAQQRRDVETDRARDGCADGVDARPHQRLQHAAAARGRGTAATEQVAEQAAEQTTAALRQGLEQVVGATRRAGHARHAVEQQRADGTEALVHRAGIGTECRAELADDVGPELRSKAFKDRRHEDLLPGGVSGLAAAHRRARRGAECRRAR